jgi:CBS domain-containing protein
MWRREDLVTAHDVMTPSPVTVSPESSLAEAWDLMRERNIRHLPVVEDGALVGMLSDRDLGFLDVAYLLAVEGADALKRELSTPVINVMSSDVVSVDAEADLSEVVELMLESKVGAVPVVRPGTRQVTGIVSYIDVLRAVQNLLEEK